MASAPTTEKVPGGRSSTSCVECRRRKQKCNREWPCNHCHARKVPHLCVFEAKINASSESPPGDSGAPLLPVSRKRKDSSIRADGGGVDAAAKPKDVPKQDVDATLSAMGFGPESIHRQLGSSVIERLVLLNDNPRKAEDGDLDVIAALKEFPSRSDTDALVQNFLHGGNFYYYIVYPPQFSQQYHDWWDDRANNRTPSKELTCLILRLCACSAQYLPPPLREKITQSAEAPSILAVRLNNAASRLSATIPPGQGGLVHVQEIFLNAFFNKAESRWIESWHALATAVREAQELGLHQNDRLKGLSEFECDMRRRIWCLLYTWDWQISHLFGRPLIINHNQCNFKLPKPKVYSPGDDEDAPSPFGHMLLQCELIKELSEKYGAIELPIQIDKAIAIQNDIERWMDAYPPIYAVNPDTSLDAKYPYLIYQRPYLHAVSYCMILIPLKPYVIQSVPEDGDERLKKTREHGIEVCFKIMDMSRVLFDQVYPLYAKFHFSFFATFDTSAILCSAIMHDEHGTLPHRQKIIRYLKDALDMLQLLASIIDTASTALQVLRQLVLDLPLTREEKQIVKLASPKRQKRRDDGAPSSIPESNSPGQEADSVTTSSVKTPDAEPLPEVLPIPHTQAMSPKQELPQHDYVHVDNVDAEQQHHVHLPQHALPQPGLEAHAAQHAALFQEPSMVPLEHIDVNDFGPYPDFSSIDFRTLDPIWDWETLDLSSIPAPGLVHPPPPPHGGQ